MDFRKLLPVFIAFILGGAAVYLAIQFAPTRVPEQAPAASGREGSNGTVPPLAEEEENDLLKAHYTRTNADEVTVTSPKPGTIITSPLTVTGEAVGGWYFEANAPVVLTNWDGLIIAESYVMAEGEWMTPEKVPFKGTIEFEKPEYGVNGFLILRNDNPSGLPEYDKAVEIPVRFE